MCRISRENNNNFSLCFFLHFEFEIFQLTSIILKKQTGCSLNMKIDCFKIGTWPCVYSSRIKSDKRHFLFFHVKKKNSHWRLVFCEIKGPASLYHFSLRTSGLLSSGLLISFMIFHFLSKVTVFVNPKKKKAI